ncbi:hypothetical protein FA13DRAFT_1717181 [Coprinellus micaceus]|uniref:Uncharacterized protein n=1 Tax=Coprinellus micaceus TaxID=71717 RepID=A0A4Y7SHZ9_COPMI|nr:hypothetical protein FA13DRAFT_1860091 [Coprinellus micaceus]TEB21214.1 hypothetical protein FA13DRAFT_1717181 [Coprinellus micaceus]
MSGRLLKSIGILFRPYPTDFLLLHNLNLLEFSLQARLPTIGLEYSTPHHLRLTYSVSRNSNRPAPGGPIPGEDLRGVADPSDLRHHCQLVYIPSHTLIVRVIKELVDRGWRQVDSGIDTGDLLDTPANSKLALSNRRSRLSMRTSDDAQNPPSISRRIECDTIIAATQRPSTIIVPDHHQERRGMGASARGDENRLEEVRADNKPAEATNSLITNQRKHLEIMINRQRIPRGEVRPHFTMAKGWA